MLIKINFLTCNYNHHNIMTLLKTNVPFISFKIVSTVIHVGYLHCK